MELGTGRALVGACPPSAVAEPMGACQDELCHLSVLHKERHNVPLYVRLRQMHG